MTDCDCRYRYLNGERERQWLAVANSDLRSDLLTLQRLLIEAQALGDALVAVMIESQDGFVTNQQWDKALSEWKNFVGTER